MVRYAIAVFNDFRFRLYLSLTDSRNNFISYAKQIRLNHWINQLQLSEGSLILHAGESFILQTQLKRAFLQTDLCLYNLTDMESELY